MISADRIPFAEAIAEPKLLKSRFDSLSLAQQAALKIMYGCDLSADRVDDHGFSELDYWIVFQGHAEEDELGYPTKPNEALIAAFPYTPMEFREGWLIVGRRAGKTDRFSSTIECYEATLGGHERFLAPRQRGICFQIAQDLRMARYSLHFIRAALESSPILKKAIKNITADRIDLSNHMTIACVPPTLKSVRGYASPTAVLDEVGSWWQESENANPDYEIYRALSPGQIQFPDRKIIGISTPWNKAGLLWRYAEAGTNGEKVPTEEGKAEFARTLVIVAPTAALRNPLVDREYLATERAKDPRAFERECLAQFQDSISGFLPPFLVDHAIQRGTFEIPPDPSPIYIAAIDSGFRRDQFAFTIVWNERGKIRQALLRHWTGSSDLPVNPQVVIDEIIPLLTAYGITHAYSDQYHFESLAQLFQQRGISLINVTFSAKSKAEMYGNLQQLFYQRKIEILDHQGLIRELKSLERHVTSGGQVGIAAPAGFHDDLATVLCIAAHQAMPLGLASRIAEERVTAEPTIHQRILEQIARKNSATERYTAWD